MSWKTCKKRGIAGHGATAWSDSPQARCNGSCPRIPFREESLAALREWGLAIGCLRTYLWILPVLDRSWTPVRPDSENVGAPGAYRECPRIQSPRANPREAQPEDSMNTA